VEGTPGERDSGSATVQILNKRQPAVAACNRDTHSSCNHVNPKSPLLAACIARDRAVSPSPPVDVSTIEPKQKMMTPTAVHQPTTTDVQTNDTTRNDDKKRKPAAKLKRYAGQGASVKSFIAQFESHAKYFQ